MARRQQQQQRYNRGQGGGGAQRIFVSVPSSGDVVKKGRKTGIYDIAIRVGLTGPQPSHSTPVKVFINGVEVALIQVQNTADHSFPGIKLDESKPAEVRVQKAGYPTDADSFTVQADWIKKAGKSAVTPAHAVQERPKRLKVSPGRVRPDSTNPLTISTYDLSGNPESVTVNIDAGQKLTVDGNNFKAGDFIKITIDASGLRRLYVKPEHDGMIDIIHPCGETESVLVLKCEKEKEKKDALA